GGSDARGYRKKRASAPETGARPETGYDHGLAAVVPQGHRQSPPADRPGGGRTRQTDRARRPRREAENGRVEPPPGRLDREKLSEPGASLPRPDPGGHPRTGPRGGEVRLPQGVQVLHLRDLVDPAGDRPRPG